MLLKKSEKNSVVYRENTKIKKDASKKEKLLDKT